MPTSLLKRLTLFFKLRGANSVNNKVAGVENRMKRLRGTVRSIGPVARTAFLALTVALGGATAASISFESAFAGVVKTVDDVADREGNLTKVGRELRKEIEQLSLVIPKSAVALANTAAVAGQFGIKAKDIVLFTATVEKLATATDIVGEQGALSLARFLKVVGEAPSRIGNVGSALVKLGNNTVAYESEILEVSVGLATMGRSLKLSSDQVLALGATIVESGGIATAASSAFQILGLDLDAAVSRGGKSLEKFAKISGLSADKFVKVFRGDALKGLEVFLIGRVEVTVVQHTRLKLVQ